jgi:hypothetical protein
MHVAILMQCQKNLVLGVEKGEWGLEILTNMCGSQNLLRRVHDHFHVSINFIRYQKTTKPFGGGVSHVLSHVPLFSTLTARSTNWACGRGQVGGTAKQLRSGGHGALRGRRGPTTPQLWFGRPVSQTATKTTPMTPLSPGQKRWAAHHTLTHSALRKAAAARKKKEGARYYWETLSCGTICAIAQADLQPGFTLGASSWG